MQTFEFHSHEDSKSTRKSCEYKLGRDKHNPYVYQADNGWYIFSALCEVLDVKFTSATKRLL